jgi:hypothetical protein
MRVLQATIIYIDTVMVQGHPGRRRVGGAAHPALTRAGQPRGSAPHVAPYGEVKLDMTSRLTLASDPNRP